MIVILICVGVFAVSKAICFRSWVLRGLAGCMSPAIRKTMTYNAAIPSNASRTYCQYLNAPQMSSPATMIPRMETLEFRLGAEVVRKGFR
ncbi:hypothetical protein D3C80_1513990 [compost metagenome]